jgi:glycosyltransferase involved in cell wall biosynthesis
MNRQEKWQARKVFISVVVPVYNEADGIAHFVSELKVFLNKQSDHYEIILVEDGSSDESATVIKTLLSDQVKWLGFSRNFGKEAALTAGLHHATGDVVLLIDADFQHPFKTAEAFFEKWIAGYDMAYGVRKNRQDESLIKRKVTHLFYSLIGKISKIPIPTDAGDFRLLDRRVVDALNAYNEQSRFMKGLYACVGFKSIAVPYEVELRTTGKSSFRIGKLFGLALTGIISFSDLPLRVWTWVGVLISSISFLYALWIVFDTLRYGVDLPGYPTLVVCILFFGGIQLLSIGILGEYISRIFQEVKKRPLYLIADSHGFNKDPL